jgi:hypothetical protein
MDYIDIPSGGMRLFGDDLNYMQVGIKAALPATLKKVADNNSGWLILSGFNIVNTAGSTFSISGGWAYIDNEICYFAGDTHTFTGVVDWATVHFESYVYDYIVGSRMMVNGSLYNPQKRRDVRLSTTQTGKTLAQSNRYEYALKALLDSLSIEQSNTITLAANVALQGNLPVKLYKKDGRVYFTANLETDAAKDYGTGSDVLCTLPIGFRPDRIVNIPVYNSARTVSYIGITNDGNVTLLNTDTQNWVASSIVSLHNISFDAA